MFNYSVIQYGESKFGLRYNDEDLKGIVDAYIKKQKSQDIYYFTYFTLCKYILLEADRADKLIGKEPNTYYQQPNLNQKAYTHISRIIWDFIFERKIFVDFSNNAYIAHYDNDTVFGILGD